MMIPKGADDDAAAVEGNLAKVIPFRKRGP
jgi:hypothetical protein